jgi:hypothetical protein
MPSCRRISANTRAVQVHDISRGGFAVKGLPEAWAKGKMIEIRCEGGGLTKPIKAEGSIVWCHDGIAGTEFMSLEPEAASVVADYVSSRTS